MQIRGMIFDLDGTLGDTLPVCFAGFRVTLRHYLGRDHSDREIRAMFGPTEEGIFQDLFPDDWEAALQMYLREYTAAHEVCQAPFAGVEDVLRRLRQQELKLGVVTGKGPGTAEISLREMGLEGVFDPVEAGSPRGGVKPECMRKVLAGWGLDSAEVACVGDAPSDIRSAHEIGAVALGAAWAGTSDYGALDALKPLETFRTTGDFAEWVEQNVVAVAGA